MVSRSLTGLSRMPSRIRGQGVNTYVWPKRAATQTWDVETMAGSKVGEIEQHGDRFGISSKEPLLLAAVASAPYPSKAEAMVAIGLYLRGRCESGGAAKSTALATWAYAG
jgi:hypothetical protein